MEQLYNEVRVIAERIVIEQCKKHYNDKHNEVATSKEIENLYLCTPDIKDKITKKQIQIIIECFNEFNLWYKIKFMWQMIKENIIMSIIMVLTMIFFYFLINIALPNMLIQLQKLIPSNLM
jgi:hypothetical protein